MEPTHHEALALQPTRLQLATVSHRATVCYNTSIRPSMAVATCAFNSQGIANASSNRSRSLTAVLISQFLWSWL